MDKLQVAASSMFVLHYQGDKFVVHDGTTWVLNEERTMNFYHDLADRGVNLGRLLGWNVWAHRADKDGNPAYDENDVLIPGIIPIDNAHNLTPFAVDPATGLFILSQWNEKYWELAERLVQIMNYPSQVKGNTAPGIRAWNDLAYQYTNDKGDIKGSPWRNNTLGTNDLYDPRNWPYFEAYVLRWFALAKKIHPMTGQPLKLDFGYGNELGGESIDFCNRMSEVFDRERVWPFSYGICADVPSDGNDLFKSTAKYIRERGLFKWHPLVQHPEDRWDTSIYRTYHACGEKRGGVDVFDTALKYVGLNPIRKVLSSDGAGMAGKPKPGADWWRAAVRTLCTLRNTDVLTFPWTGIENPPMVCIEHLPDDRKWDECREEQLGVFAAIADEYKKYLGPLENDGQWPDAWVEPVIVVPPGTGSVVDGPAVKPPFNLNGWWNNNHKTVYASIIGIIVLVVLSILIF